MPHHALIVKACLQIQLRSDFILREMIQSHTLAAHLLKGQLQRGTQRFLSQPLSADGRIGDIDARNVKES